MCPRAGQAAVEYSKIFCHCRESNPGRPARNYTDSAIPALFQLLHNKKNLQNSFSPLSLHWCLVLVLLTRFVAQISTSSSTYVRALSQLLLYSVILSIGNPNIP
jgi:hypothetical protein